MPFAPTTPDSAQVVAFVADVELDPFLFFYLVFNTSLCSADSCAHLSSFGLSCSLRAWSLTRRLSVASEYLSMMTLDTILQNY